MVKQKFRIKVRPSVEKDLNHIDTRYHRKIWESIYSLIDDPLPKEHKKLQGSEKHYRIRVGRYRIVYELSLELKTVYIQRIKPRQSVYRKK